MSPTLFLLVGLPGAGKTTLARQLERQHAALRLTPDDWMKPLFGAGDLNGKRAVLEHDLLWSVAARVLGLGVSVVLDYGLWSPGEREMYLSRAHALGARAELHALDLPVEQLWQRLEARNVLAPQTPQTFVVSREELLEWNGWFQRPLPDELARFDHAEVRHTAEELTV